ncbi:amino acid adenylation domain-containing protein [Streptomyces sp. NPDC005795]|uniref:non-ribosomal peptide synthetase n=1 Tax=Streptomyces sp. NPDC005795 TaxID=3154677 RepID=UPI0033E7C5CA
MSSTEVLRDIESRGLSLTAEGENLRLQGPKERVDPGLVARIREHKAGLLAHLAETADTDGTAFALTPLQQSYLFGRSDIFEIGNVGSHTFHEIEGCWDIDRLEEALRGVVARHGALRTAFTASGAQVERPAARVAIGRLDLRSRNAEEAAEQLIALREERSHRVLAADLAPLLAVDVTVLDDTRMVMHVGHDGLVMDGISMFLFFRAWWTLYEEGPDPDAPEETPFPTYVEALEKARTRAPAERSRRYWEQRLDTLPGCPELPLAADPATVAQPRFIRREIRLDPTAWEQLRKRAAAAGVTPSCLLLAAYGETLATWGAGPRFTVVTTVANRPPVHPRIDRAIGNYSDTLLVELDTDRSRPFADRVAALGGQLRRDLDHRHHSGIDVMRELARRRGGTARARMPFTFNSAIDYVDDELDGTYTEAFGKQTYAVSQTPQVWLNVFVMQRHGGLVIQLDGVEQLFPDALLTDLAEGYRTLLTALLDPESRQRRDFDLLPPAQRARRAAVNDTAGPVPDGFLQDRFLDRAAQNPDAPAIITADRTMSYGELLRRATRAAVWLREQGVERQELVGLVMTRGPEQVIGVLATALAGAAYLPVDASLPEARQEYMLDDGRVRHVLTNSGHRPAGGRAVLALDATAEAGTGPVERLAALPGAHPDDLAYVIYTSGTTGKPKGVMATHRGVLNIVDDCNSRFSVTAADRFFGISAFNFDLSVYDFFGALAVGAAVVLPDAEHAADPRHWLALCEQARVSVWNSVPAIASLLQDQAATDGGAVPDSLRLVMMSGDTVPSALPGKLRALWPELDVYSLGGATETTIWSILHPIDPGADPGEPVPYGRPSLNNRVYVRDRDGLDAPDGVVGEICFAGVGTVPGYWGDAERTAERFVDDARRGERLYRTGDLGRFLPDGNVAILGRSDDQFKVNGFRIEAGEVETRLVALPEVAEASVVRHRGDGGDRLVAHAVPSGEDRPGMARIREALSGELPGYMIPSAVVWHETLPLTGNGKVDRGRLAAVAPAEAAPALTGAAGAAPGSETEKTVAAIWAGVLETADVPVGTPLYDLGGTSIGAARIFTAIRKRFGVTLQLNRLPEVETVRLMAAHIDAHAPKEAGRS